MARCVEIQDGLGWQNKCHKIGEDVKAGAGDGQMVLVDAFARDERIEQLRTRIAGEDDDNERGQMESHSEGHHEPSHASDVLQGAEDADVEQENGGLDTDVRRNVEDKGGKINLKASPRGQKVEAAKTAVPACGIYTP